MIYRIICKVDHEIDVTNYSEISNEYAKQLLLHHAEKKSLAFLLDKGVNNIVINVNMRMCSDCHKLFCNV